MYVAELSVFVTDRSERMFAVSVSVALLFPATGSVVPPATAAVAVFASGAVADDAVFPVAV